MSYTNGLDNPELYFQTKLYTGNGTAIGSGGLTVTFDGSENMQPDWVWIKNRDGTDWHDLFDSVRGVTKRLYSNSTNAENTNTEGLTAFGTNGFTVGNSGDVNTNTNNHVSWNWKAGTSFTNDASSTGIGSIDSSGSVSTDAGFSIISYTGTGSNGTIAHGLGLTPKMMIFKNRSAVKGWSVYHNSLGATKFIFLNETNLAETTSTMFNNTEPTSTLFTVNTDLATNVSGNNYIAYCFAEKKGYSKFGSYTGNGNADGTFVYTGFKPAWLLIKQSSGAGNDWLIYDNKRDASNVASTILLANGTGAEATGQSFNYIDLLSNGFKLRGSDARNNGSGGTMIYMAFAESPFVNSNGAVPNNAR